MSPDQRDIKWASPHTRGWTPARPRSKSTRTGFPAHAGMDLTTFPDGDVRPGLPRTRGDGPLLRSLSRRMLMASPHTRGWTHAPSEQLPVAVGFPAHAGMDPATPAPAPTDSRLPRTRGDGPVSRRRANVPGTASPHTRGWTRPPPQRPPPERGFPAHAGMDRKPTAIPTTRSGLPRTRGDGPHIVLVHLHPSGASPHTRGWTRRIMTKLKTTLGFPAHAGMDPSLAPRPARPRWLPRTRGDGPFHLMLLDKDTEASPHTRGWTRIPEDCYRAADGLPRTRGDGPRAEPAAPRPAWGFPAHAGMDPSRWRTRCGSARLPRTRGDGPSWNVPRPNISTASPHTRGWTRPAHRPHAARRGFPAHAGMDPWPFGRPIMTARLPRTRGDGPYVMMIEAKRVVASPHTRGWTRIGLKVESLTAGFPAHAGMDPDTVFGRVISSRLPRTRGDGPVTTAAGAAGSAASPHTRGWTVEDARLAVRALGFPAHAGMDPHAQCYHENVKRLPRTRGDGPTCGLSLRCSRAASPHTRGWTQIGQVGVRRALGFPAHAGMDRTRRPSRRSHRRLPRTRGDGPRYSRYAHCPAPASPHTRGWTLTSSVDHGLHGGFPAHAGMDPSRTTQKGTSHRLPRTRGDGPTSRSKPYVVPVASPHTRGWTSEVGGQGRVIEGFPAHAGMDPGRRPSAAPHRGLPRTRGDGPPGNPSLG